MVDEAEYKRRIADVESYYSERASWHHPERMYLPYCLDAMFFVCEVIEADFYQVERPEPENTWTRRALDYWTERWGQQ